MCRIGVLVFASIALTSSAVYAASPCKRGDEQFSRELRQDGYGVFLERSESLVEVWTAKLPDRFAELHLNGVRLERRVAGDLILLAYLAERPAKNIVWVTAGVPAAEKGQYAIVAMYTTHPGFDDVCSHVLSLPLAD